MLLRCIAILLLAALIGMPGVTPAAAQTCHHKAVKSKSAAGILEATAKSRARSLWIKAVRAKKKLGPDYAAWLRAKDAAYTCRRQGKRFQCEASAVPCRIEPAPGAAVLAK